MGTKILSIAVDNELLNAMKELLEKSDIDRQERNNLLLTLLPFYLSLDAKFKIGETIDGLVNYSSLSTEEKLE